MPGLARASTFLKDLPCPKTRMAGTSPAITMERLSVSRPEDYCTVSTRFLTAVVDGSTDRRGARPDGG